VCRTLELKEEVPDIASHLLAQLARPEIRSGDHGGADTLRHIPGTVVTPSEGRGEVAALASLGRRSARDVRHYSAWRASDICAGIAPEYRAAPARAREAFERMYFEYHIARDGGNMSGWRKDRWTTHLYRKLKDLGLRRSQTHEIVILGAGQVVRLVAERWPRKPTT